MGALLRLAKKGPKKRKIMRLAAQSKKAKLSGKFLEHLGYWMPKGSDMNERCLILNKHRIRYWLNCGGIVSGRSQHLLCMAGMMHPVWIPHGRSFNYEKKPKGTFLAAKIASARDRYPNMSEALYKIAREQEEENILLRKIKEDRAVLDLVLNRLDTDEIKPEEILSDDEDEYVRSRMFYKLTDMLEAIDREVKVLQPAKRELIVKKINKLAKLGILSKKQTEERSKTFDSDLYSIEEARKVQLLKKFGRVNVTMEELKLQLTPISKEEFMDLYERNMEQKLTNAQIDEVASILYERLAESGQVMTRYLAFQIINKEELDKPLPPITEETMLNSGPIVIPNKYPVTPFPDMNDYEPNDFYDLRPGPSEPINNSRVRDQWFDVSPTRKEEYFKKLYPKEEMMERTVYPNLRHQTISSVRLWDKIGFDKFPGLKKRKQNDNKWMVIKGKIAARQKSQNINK